MKCRSCGSRELEIIVALGCTPLANALLASPDAAEETYPLELAWCPGCTLLQITESVPPEVLFRDYVYFSSFSDTMLRHAQEVAEELIHERKLTSSSLVIEAASNDGYLLQFFKRAGIPVLGIEPALDVAAAAETKGIRTINEFFGESLAKELDKADLFMANNVLAHAPDVNEFVAGIRTVLKPDGVAVIETPYARDMIEKCEFDTIYHEHVFYYSITALNALFARHGLMLERVEHIPLHGGSLRVFVRQGKGGWRVDEPWAGDRGYYAAFSDRIVRLKDALLGLLDGKDLAAYGAAAKGSTLLNCFGIRNVRYVVDRNPVKQGKYMPGVRIPICAPQKLLEDRPHYVLLLAWNLADEILQQQAEYRRQGGQFIIPVPEPKVV